MALTRVKPSPARGRCRSESRTSKVSVAISLRASRTFEAATTSNPSRCSPSCSIRRTESSSSATKILGVVMRNLHYLAAPNPLDHLALQIALGNRERPGSVSNGTNIPTTSVAGVTTSYILSANRILSNIAQWEYQPGRARDLLCDGETDSIFRVTSLATISLATISLAMISLAMCSAELQNGKAFSTGTVKKQAASVFKPRTAALLTCLHLC